MPKPKTDSRDRLIETASRLFQRQGYQGTGLSQIVEESGAPRGSVYFLFPGGKEELAAQAIEQSAAYVRKQIEIAASNSRSAEEWIRNMALHFVHDLEASNYVQGCPVSTVALESGPDHPALQNACRQAYDSWLEDITAILTKFGIQEEADELAIFFLSAVEGALILCRVTRSAEHLEICVNSVMKMVKLRMEKA